MSSSKTDATSIDELFKSQKADSKHKSYGVFVFPGIGTPAPEDWYCKHQKPWLKSLVDRASDEGTACTVLAIRHHLTPKILKSWHDLLLKGAEALQAIEAYRKQEEISNHPIIFICHSLGGVIAKQALIHAKRSNEDHDSLFASLCGLVFLSTPHVPDDDSEEWQKPLGIILMNLKEVGSQLSTEKELQIIARVSHYFEDMTLPLPILTTWETKPTKLKGLIYYHSKSTNKCVLVDRKLSKTYTGEEEDIPFEGDHKDTCALHEHSKFGKRLLAFGMRCLKAAIEVEGPTHTSSTATPARVDSLSANPVPETTYLPKASSHMALDTTHLQSSDVSEARPDRKFELGRKTKSLPQISVGKKAEANPVFPLASFESTIFVDDFFRREEVLKQLEDSLVDRSATTSSSAPQLALLHGIGGIGKTSIAAEYMRTRQNAYDAVFFIRADTVGKIMDTCGRMAVMLKLLEPDKTQDLAYARKLVLDWLEDPVTTFEPVERQSARRARWLLVFDNVDDYSVLKEFWPKSGSGAILITSRRPPTGTRLQAARTAHIPLRPFSESDAVDFLRGLVPEGEDPKDNNASMEVVRRLDCIPLALRQIGDYIVRRDLTFRQFLDVYADETTYSSIYAEKPELGDTEYEHTLSTVWALQSLNETTLALLNVMALLDPDHIKESTLVQGDELPQISTYPLNKAAYFEARTELWRSSLISIHKSTGEISLHRIVQGVARSLMGDEQFEHACNTASEILLRDWPVKGRMWHYPVDHWPLCEALLSHFIKLHEHFTSNSTAKNLTSPNPSLAKGLTYAGWFSHERGDFHQAKAFFATAERLCDGNDRLQDLLTQVWKCQGCVATETNDGNACVTYNTRLLEMTQKRIPQPKTPEDFDELSIAYNEMGVGYMMMDDIATALDMLEMAKFHSEHNRKASDTATSVYMLASANLGLAHWLQGHWEDSLNILMRAYHWHTKRTLVGEKDSFAPGRLMHAIGNVKVSQGLDGSSKDLDSGFQWHKTALNHYLNTIGEGHHRTADVSHRLADDHLRSGEYKTAEMYLDKALKVFDSKEFYWPEKMRTMHLMGLLKYQDGEEQEGAAQLKEARRLYAVFRKRRHQDVPTENPTQEDFDSAITFWSR